MGLALCMACLPSARAADVSSLTLRDQYGGMDGLQTDGDGLQIAIVVSAKRLRRIRPWEEAIRRIDEDVRLIRVADVPRTAPTDFDAVAEKLAKRLPESLLVLIDLDGAWVTAFDLDSSVPNVLIFDGSGTLLARHSGMYKARLFAPLEADLRNLTAALSRRTPGAGPETGPPSSPGGR